jgi:EAL domain-containing protein (putative c-di-GMP-specific phosphodiesterase class I)/DNA-binding response OmpR family regulator
MPAQATVPAHPEHEPVLVVDDESGPRNVTALALRSAGLDVVEATTGEDALRIVERQPVSVAIVDINMPGMSGTEVVRNLRGRAETATLPIILMTGSGDEHSVVAGLDAGADDFLEKPVRLDELVARVRARLRSQQAWGRRFEDELRARAGVVAALGELTLSLNPEEAAVAVVTELSRRTNADFLGVLQVASSNRLQELAMYSRRAGVRTGRAWLPAELASRLLDRARQGPYLERIAAHHEGVQTVALGQPDVALVAVASIRARDEVVGLLALGLARTSERATAADEEKLLAAVIDYASVLSAVSGASLADRQRADATTEGLRTVIANGEFHPVFQPIVSMHTRSVVGFEALTRFDDESEPFARFTEAAALGLGRELELATVEAALGASTRLPAGTFLALNMSPNLVLGGGEALRELLESTSRSLIVELTEHAAIEDYVAVRRALRRLPVAGLSVDDAGAGYASLRHILELKPAYAKLDVSLVREIDRDRLRQALAAGLEYYAIRSGCRLIAEGVETEAQADVLQGLGIELGQGFLFGRPSRA